jgi:hypothetical protein
MIDANPEQLLALLLGGVVLELSVEEAKPLSLLSRARSEGLALPAGFWASRSLRRLGTAALLVPCRSAREPAGLAVAATPQVGGGSLSPRAGRWPATARSLQRPPSGLPLRSSRSVAHVRAHISIKRQSGIQLFWWFRSRWGWCGLRRRRSWFRWWGVMGCRGGAWMVAACEVVSGRRGGESSKQTWSRSGEVGRTVGFDGGVGAKNRWVRVSVAGVFWQP